MMVKRETIKTQALNFAFSKAEAVVNTTASKVKALEIHNMENNDESKFLASYSRKMSFSKKKLISVGATISHAEFLSGRSDETGDLMNKLALINVATMKLVKEEGEIHLHSV